jgi:hypothetical protein
MFMGTNHMTEMPRYYWRIKEKEYVPVEMTTPLLGF